MQLIRGDVEVGQVVVLLLDLDVAVGELLVLLLDLAEARLDLEHLGAALADHRHRGGRGGAYEAHDAAGAEDARGDGAVDAEQAARLRPGQAAQVELAGEWLPGELMLVGREPLEQGYRLEVGFEAPASVNAMAGQRLKVRIDD